MGKTYGVPRSAKGETRILFIFTIKSLILTVAMGAIGLIFYVLFKFIGLGTIGLIITILFAGAGFAMATLTIPDSPMLGKLRKAGRGKFRRYSLENYYLWRKKKIIFIS